jgi:hypothetical protein
VTALNPAATADTRAGEPPGAVPGPWQDHEEHRPGTQDSQDHALQAGDDPLAWPVAAMSGALRRFTAAGAGDIPQAVAAAAEAVWWITVVNAAVNRHHPAAYSQALAALDPAPRRAVERSLAGLRFIRSQLSTCADPADFIQPPPSPGARPATAWTWNEVSPPHPQRGKARDVSPYREYRAQLAGRPVAAALGQASGFLAQVHATATRPGRHQATSTKERTTQG